MKNILSWLPLATVTTGILSTVIGIGTVGVKFVAVGIFLVALSSFLAPLLEWTLRS